MAYLNGQLKTAAHAYDPEAVVISLRMRGHAGASGYDRLQEYLDCQLIRPPAQWSLAQRVAARSLRTLMKRSGSLWYHRAGLISELSAAREWMRGKGRVFHFLYGENSYRYLGLMKSVASGNSIVCTYHTPPGKFAQVVKDRKHITRLDAVIVVSTVQSDFFTRIIGRERVFFVPHGIDVDYFSPGEKIAPPGEIFRCLFVGSHLRDIATLTKAAKFLSSSKDVRFTVVTKPGHQSAFSGMDNVDLKSGINDDQLLGLYRSSDILVLPLLDSTANNSLLEAMACGLPIVTTDLQGVRDYVNKECAVVMPKGDASALAEAILWLKRDDGARSRMAQASRQRAMDFSWQNIARQTAEVYRAVA